MAYYRDLTCYVYSGRRAGALNVGWLSAVRPYERGRVSKRFLERLFRFASVFVQAMRGFHVCDLCEEPEETPLTVVHGDLRVRRLGWAEIRVVHPDGTVFAAPNLVLHYVIDHGYRPPTKFIEAVLKGLCPPSEAYFYKLRELKLAYQAHRDEGLPGESRLGPGSFIWPAIHS